MQRTNKLFEPISIGNAWIKNRVALAPINNSHQMDPTFGTITQRCVDYYVEIAKGGVGHIITGVFKVENEIEKCMANGLFVWPMLTEKSLPEYHELTDYAHAYGVKVFIQLSAGPGRVTPPQVINSGITPVSASANQAHFAPDVTCRALATEEVAQIVEAFGRAAELVVKAGFDGIEVHGHEGYLIDQFATSLWNSRTDKYGGDLRGRLTFPIEILNAVKEKAADLPVTYRYGVKHFIAEPWRASLHGDKELGRDLPESIEMAKLLEEAGYDGLSLDTGCYDSIYYAHPPNYLSHGFTADLVKEVKKAVSIPILAASRLGMPEVAEEVLNQEKADIILLGRDLLADPEWPKKVFEGRTEDVRPCIACHDGCLHRPSLGAHMSCSVNPACGRANAAAPALTFISKRKKVVVVGGGVAGMEAARMARSRGHEVPLYEKAGDLGGHLIAISVPDFNVDIKRLLDWYKGQLDKLRIEMKLGSSATPELLREEEADVVIIATGSTYLVPEIPGISQATAHTCSDLYLDPGKAGKNIVVIGGGNSGCQNALWLAQQGKEVTLIEQASDIATDTVGINRSMLLDMLADSKVEIVANTKVQELRDGDIIAVDSTSGIRDFVCDTVVLAAGMQADNALYRSLTQDLSDLHLIGDGKEPRVIHDAILEGYIVGQTIS
jgi:2-enoate reductase